MQTQNAELDQSAQTAGGKVTVYRFKRMGTVQDDEFASEIFATPQAIERFEAELIVGSAIDVDRSELDGYGRYHPEKRHATRIANAQQRH
jgi:hypothetical protein